MDGYSTTTIYINSGVLTFGIELQNFNNREGEHRQLYRIRYGYGEPLKEVHLLTSGFVDALEIFPVVYQSESNNPSQFPTHIDEDSRENALSAISSIDKIAEAVIARKN